jgi:hypothetical protein
VIFMKLGKLLGVGKSFFGSDPMAAYHLNKRTSLPKFNDGKNPFAPKTAEAVTGSAATPAPTPAPPKAERKPANGSSLTIAQAVAMAEQARAKKAQASYVLKPLAKPAVQPTAKAVAQPTAQPAAKPARSGWTMRLNPFRPPEPVALPIAEQTELSLDSVKVVHNDLADADVEVVSAKSHSAPAPTPAVLPPPQHAWEYLGENLLKSS